MKQTVLLVSLVPLPLRLREGGNSRCFVPDEDEPASVPTAMFCRQQMSTVSMVFECHPSEFAHY